jgi:hypothetical protein
MLFITVLIGVEGLYILIFALRVGDFWCSCRIISFFCWSVIVMT